MEAWFGRTATWTSYQAGRAHSFIANLLLIAVWVAAGPFFNYSDSWQLIVNTATTVVTYLMVFLLQHTQNRDTLALQIKLDALIEASSAQNHLMLLDGLPDEELRRLKARLESKA